MLAAQPQTRRRLALGLLRQLEDLRARGLREPLPLPCLSAAAYAQAIWQGAGEDEALAGAEGRWRSSFHRSGEDAEPEHRLVWGDELPFSELLSSPLDPDEHGDGWPEQASSRFAIYARRLWDPLLERERIEPA
jgi:exodeoxyribonuclease V gamma subunit